ncbi:putative maltose O-acetyltransferase [Cytospora mali]|uniref:Maltose O-acetyltransferase n=1 Tax=Cytospora mali TaxID=578113 RepID=A0A194UYJ8_CYTMA|nr:putative maltose O-acetyltransferase [Valsa mali var. pyri (nom. inval.)]
MTMSTFKPLNGGASPQATETNGGSADGKRAGSAERTNGPSKSSDQQPQQPPTIEIATSQREREGWAASVPGHDRSPYSSAQYPDIENSHKRKRSELSESPRREGPAHADRPQNEAHPERSQHSELRERDPYERHQRERDYRSYGDDCRERDRERHREREPWYSPHERRDEREPYSQPASAAPDSAHTDEQVGDALRRATEDYQSSPDGDDRSMGYGSYTPEQRRDGVIQSDAKKRKRNFSNRTKTGCLTCRKRKKKCDEAKPECSNCLRGGFVCAGYPQQRGTFSKPENKVQTIQIESKDPTYVPPGAYGMPQQAPFPNQTQQPQPQQQKREPLPSYRGQPLRIEPPQGRPVLTDDDRLTASTLPTASVNDPNEKLSALSSAFPNTPANVFPTPVSAAPIPFPERGLKEYQRVPPLHDLTRTEPDLTPQSTTLPHINIMHATRTNSPIQTPQSGTNPQTTAQLALSHTSQFPSPIQPPGGPNNSRREKDEMMAGRPFYPFEKELVLERERCSSACWRFNNSTNPNNGVSPVERARLFREILIPKDPIQLSPTQHSPVTHTGRVGEEVVVEAPFTCDYGYNIRIGKNTVIGRNCTVLDACEVFIGNNVVIGPNVNIYTTTMTTDPRRRNGARGANVGKSIIIEDDVFIGGGVTILGGVKIGRGTTVGAGSVVTKSQPSYCICVGNPAKVRRGIASAYP